MGFVLLGLIGVGLRGILRDEKGELVAHGPFLVPRSLVLSSIPPAPSRPGFSLPQFIIRNSAFIIRPFWGTLAFAQPSDRRGLGFFKADITGAETITTVAGTGTAGFAGDGGPATSAQLRGPRSVSLDASGNLFIADDDNERIRKVATGTGTITTVAGTGTAGFAGDGGPATSAQLNEPSDVAPDGSGNLFIADQLNNRIRKVAAGTGIISTVAGSGPAGAGLGGFGGDGGPATSAQLNLPRAVALDGSGNLFIADQSNHRIRKVVLATGFITTVAGSGPTGTGQGGFGGDDGPATGARLNGPAGLALDGSGNLFIADRLNNRVRKVAAGTGIITTVAGAGAAGVGGDGGPATSAQLNGPFGLALDASAIRTTERLSFGSAFIGVNRRFLVSWGPWHLGG